MRLLTIAAAALATLLFTIALANAQEPPESQTATRLEPGINLVGWVGESTSVSQLFREIPQLESIWAWNAELDDWVVAGRGAPEGLGWLWRVSPGMGLRLAVGGEEPFLWQRSTEPTSGLVELRTGWNLVAWSGADDAPLEQVSKGIGWSLRELRRWNAANQQWTTWTSPERSAQLIATSATDQGATSEEAEPVTVRRGEALWINVARSVNWLQPTDMLPRLVFPGGASDELQARVREDLEAVLAFYGQQYGIQAEPDFTVYVAKDAEALIQAQKDDGYEIDDAEAARIRALWDRVGAWVDREIVVRQAAWPEVLSPSDISWVRYTLTHEYFHILQIQMADGWPGSWLTEGTATWADNEHLAIDGARAWEDAYNGWVSSITEDTPSLRSTESDNAAWEYTLGWLATDRLTTAAGDESYLEFWRRLASTEIGPHGRWTSTPDWRTAFQETFGIPVSSFYADFDAWQREQAAANEASASSGDDEARWIRGRATDESGAPVTSVFVNAIRVEGETSVGWNQRAETDVDGTFAVRAPEDGDYRISVDIADDCTRYYSDGGLIDFWEWKEKPHAVTVDGSDVRGMNMQLPANICGWQIRGQVVDAAGEPLAGISVGACQIEAGSSHCWWLVSTTLDGSFTVSAPSAGEYRLGLDLTDGCRVYFRTAGVALSSSDASLITVADTDVDGLTLRVPDNVCAHQIIGRVTKADGQPLADTHISACHESGHGPCAGRNTGNNGSFAITVPADGRYSVDFGLEGCTIYFQAGGFTTSYSERSTAQVAGRDVRLSPHHISAELCAYRISGTLVGAGGAPLAETTVWAREQINGEFVSGAETDGDGSFTIIVPVNGAYHLSFFLDRCTVYFGRDGLTSNSDNAWLIRVDGRVQLSQRRVPADLCSQQISGRLVNAAGEPLAQVHTSICQLVGDDCATWLNWLSRRTDADGSFAVTVPAAGAYLLSFSLNGCNIYYRAGSLTTRQADASRITVTEDNSPSLQIRVPEGVCALRISGRLVDANGTPLAEKWIHARNPDGAYSAIPTDANGRFEIRVPSDGAYHFDFPLQYKPSYCHYEFEGQDLGSPDNPVRVSGADVTGVELRLPGTIEELCG